MSERFPELEVFSIQMPAETRARHIASIDSTLRAQAQRRRLGRRLVVAVAALVLALPVAGLAAEDAVPGDPLYGLKRLVEPVLALADPELPAVHRLEELETLLANGTPPAVVSAAFAEAADAVAATGSESLHTRLEELTDSSDDASSHEATPPPEPAPTLGDGEDQTDEDRLDARTRDEGPATTTTTTPPTTEGDRHADRRSPEPTSAVRDDTDPDRWDRPAESTTTVPADRHPERATTTTTSGGDVVPGEEPPPDHRDGEGG